MRPLPWLDAVVFDAGGTLVRLDFEWLADGLRELGAPVDALRLRRAEVAGRRRYDASFTDGHGSHASSEPLGGGGDPLAYFGGMLEAAGVPEAILPRALERLERRQLERGLWARAMEGARRAIDGAAALGLRLAVVSNSDGRAAYHLREAGVLDGLEFVVDSHQVGIEKPDARIFGLALERLGTAPDRALYVGDILSVDARGAAAAGMRFVLIDPYGDYAPAAMPRIPHVGALPEWIRVHHRVRPHASALAAAGEDVASVHGGSS